MLLNAAETLENYRIAFTEGRNQQIKLLVGLCGIAKQLIQFIQVLGVQM